MSVTVDANVLIYASNEADPVHGHARRLVERLAAGPELVYMFWPVIMAYLRVVTQASVLPRPLSLAEASANIENLLRLPHVRSAGEGEGFWTIFRATATPQIKGNALTDAHIASLMRQHGVATIYTRDRDFRRFDGIQVKDPFA